MTGQVVLQLAIEGQQALTETSQRGRCILQRSQRQLNCAEAACAPRSNAHQTRVAHLLDKALEQRGLFVGGFHQSPEAGSLVQNLTIVKDLFLYSSSQA